MRVDKNEQESNINKKSRNTNYKIDCGAHHKK